MLASSAAWLLVLFLGVQPAAFPAALTVESCDAGAVATFLENRFSDLPAASMLGSSIGGWVATGAASRARAQTTGRRPGISREGEPAQPGEPRRGAPPKAQADAKRRGEGSEATGG
ncbi:MAG: hypothetical protein DCC73_05475 [Proteobacteria bacterium]|nr:MAG: hypothetical protein DCC73_05475 [Pseudomonadota bacterium]